jgi:non-specific serine/threonine protein kinase
VNGERVGDSPHAQRTPTGDDYKVDLRGISAPADGGSPGWAAVTCPACGHKLTPSAALRRGGLVTAQEMAADLFRVLCELEPKAGPRTPPVPAAAAPDPSTWAHRLTPRECEVAALLGELKTDNEIALRLHISRNTARSYSAAVLSKLELHSRRHVHPLQNA